LALVDASAGGGGGTRLSAASISVGTGIIRSNGGNSVDCGDGGKINLPHLGAVLLAGPSVDDAGVQLRRRRDHRQRRSVEIRNWSMSGGDGPRHRDQRNAGDLVVTLRIGGRERQQRRRGQRRHGADIDLFATGNAPPPAPSSTGSPRTATGGLRRRAATEP
jgi:hypothetical protein